MNYLSELNKFILTNDPLVQILDHLDLESLYSVLFICKFYYNNFRVKEAMKRKKIDKLLDPETLAADPITWRKEDILNSNSDISKLLIPTRLFLSLINPLLFDNQIRIYCGITNIVIHFYSIPYLFPRCSPGVALNPFTFNIQIMVASHEYAIHCKRRRYTFWKPINDNDHDLNIFNDIHNTTYIDITKKNNIVLDIFKYSTTLDEFEHKFEAS